MKEWISIIGVLRCLLIPSLDILLSLEAELGREADLPLYFSENLKPGMRVKQLDLVIAANDAVYFGLEITIPELFEVAGMVDAESYLFVANDGYAVEIPAAAIPFGRIYPDEKKGYLRVEFAGYTVSELPVKLYDGKKLPLDPD